MKQVASILVLMVLQLNLLACSYSPSNFCTGLDSLSNDIVIAGEIVSIDSTGIDIKIIDVLRGAEVKQIIRVWDGRDFYCNEWVSMAASKMGALYDTLVAILPVITEKDSEWDIIGDYRRPLFTLYTTQLKVEKGIVSGYFNGRRLPNSTDHLVGVDYNEFVIRFILGDACTMVLTNTIDVFQELSISVNNPFSSKLKVRFNELVRDGLVRIHSMAGRSLLVEKIMNEYSKDLDASRLQNGMYILEIEINGQRKIIKVVKQY